MSRSRAPSAGATSSAPAARALQAAFYARADTRRLLRGHARLVDGVVAGVWAGLGAPADAALKLANKGRLRMHEHPRSFEQQLELPPRTAYACELTGAP